MSGEIGEEYDARREKEEPVNDLLELVATIVPYHMSHNAGKWVVACISFTSFILWSKEQI